ncbi:NPK1-activating kinesin-like protein, C-terminal [Dillenia turbinata]|uniref:NPK1-activating kinesin-like protein, C-terminal n=1 Tax=Dillenia turbinata TaxID=194707 RepID=A0AAN8ZIP7_9MAGN
MCGICQSPRLPSINLKTWMGHWLLVQEKGKYTDSEEKASDVGLYMTAGFLASPSNWASEFERQQGAIIELWDACHVPLVHRTVFFLLFKGEPSDSVYLEVELRRLSFLKDTLFPGSRTTKDGPTISLESSLKALNREREALSKQLKKKYSEKERESLFLKFGIGLKTKERKLQLAHRLWSNTKDMNHIKESAAIVAKLDGLVELGQAPKEMFGFTFAPSPVNRRSFSWKPSMSSIM